MTGNAPVIGGFALARAEQEAEQKERKKRLRGLSRIFAKAAFGMATTFAIKSTVVSVATFAGANVIFAAAAGGLAITTFSAINDYRAELKKQKTQKTWDSFKGFFGFIGNNRKKYAAKLALNAGLAGAGSAIVEFSEEISSIIPEPIKQTAKSLFSSAGSLLSGIGNMIVPMAHAQEVVPQSFNHGTDMIAGGAGDDTLVGAAATDHILQPDTLTHVDQAQIDVPTTITPETRFAEFVENTDTSGWSEKALSDLAFAERGQAWAIQNLAYYSLNTNDIPFDIEMARSFASIAEEQGSSLATQFLSDIEKISPITEGTENAVKADTIIADTVNVSTDDVVEVPTSTASVATLMEGMDTSNWSDAAKASLAAAERGQAWAIQNLAHFALNDPTVPYDLDWARAMAELAQEKGSNLSARFLADIDRIEAASPTNVDIANIIEGSDNVIAFQPQNIVDTSPVDVITNGDKCSVIPGNQPGMFSVDCANENYTLQDGEALKLHFANGHIEEFQNAYGHPITVASLVEGDVLNVLMRDPETNVRIFEEPVAGTQRYASLQP